VTLILVFLVALINQSKDFIELDVDPIQLRLLCIGSGL